MSIEFAGSHTNLKERLASEVKSEIYKLLEKTTNQPDIYRVMGSVANNIKNLGRKLDIKKFVDKINTSDILVEDVFVCDIEDNDIEKLMDSAIEDFLLENDLKKDQVRIETRKRDVEMPEITKDKLSSYKDLNYVEKKAVFDAISDDKKAVLFLSIGQ